MKTMSLTIIRVVETAAMIIGIQRKLLVAAFPFIAIGTMYAMVTMTLRTLVMNHGMSCT
jgi:hypothetical protein